MGVSPGNRPAVPRDWFPYLNGTPQGQTSEDTRKTATSVVASYEANPRCLPFFRSALCHMLQFNGDLVWRAALW